MPPTALGAGSLGRRSHAPAGCMPCRAGHSPHPPPHDTQNLRVAERVLPPSLGPRSRSIEGPDPTFAAQTPTRKTVKASAMSVGVTHHAPACDVREILAGGVAVAQLHLKISTRTEPRKRRGRQAGSRGLRCVVVQEEHVPALHLNRDRPPPLPAVLHDLYVAGAWGRCAVRQHALGVSPRQDM